MEASLDLEKWVFYQNKRYQIKSLLSLDSLKIQDPVSGQVKSVKISDLAPDIRETESEIFPELSLISQKDWDEAKRRQSIIHPLSQLSFCPIKIAEEAAIKLGVTFRYIYKLIKIYRESGQKLIALLPKKSSGGKGKSRLSKAVEMIIEKNINEFYLSRQKYTFASLHEEICANCYRRNILPPSLNTIKDRIKKKKLNEIIQKREGVEAARQQCNPIIGTFPAVNYPLAVVQIDHTVVDVIIVDEINRKPIGRPYITIAIDVLSRCVTGICLSLDPPSSVSVGLCLVHSIFDKEEWLEIRGLEKDAWPIWGLPDSIYVDNGTEFHSEALQRGCEAHGIKINYRPVKTPHYGGIVERIIGTLMRLVHRLPGTTFSNIVQRGKYPSEKYAALTLRELEHWLTIAITEYYHKKVHRHLGLSPMEKYRQGILGKFVTKKDGEKIKMSREPGCGYPNRVYDKQRFLIDFLPIERRKLQREGFVLDRITYYGAMLNPFINNRMRYEKFLIRRDPRDLSQIYVLDPIDNQYLKVPYRMISRPPITLWEHRSVLKELKAKKIQKIDEEVIFNAIEKLHSIKKQAVKQTTATRRQDERRKLTNRALMEIKPAEEKDTGVTDKNDDGIEIPSHLNSKVFEDIEFLE